MTDCVDPDRIVYFRSYAILVRAVLTCPDGHATHVVRSALSRKQRNCVQNYWLNGAMYSGPALCAHVSTCTFHARGQISV